MGRLQQFIRRFIDFLFGRKLALPKYNILIVCTGNTCRSPMAQKAFEAFKTTPRYAEILGTVKSAGTSVHEKKASVNAIKVVSEVFTAEMSLDNHVPTQLTQELIDEADIILTTDANKAQLIREKFDTAGKVKTLATFGGGSGSIIDPYGGPLELYYKTYFQMERFIGKGIKDLYEKTVAKRDGRV